MIDFAAMFQPGALAAFGKVITIDLMLAGDNVIVLGALAAGLPPEQRKKVIGLGVGFALFFLIGFAFLATQLLNVVGLLFAGGLLLVWVAWKLFRELRQSAAAKLVQDEVAGESRAREPKSFLATAIQVMLADLSMSLDNVLAVAGAARDHPYVLFFGLALSVTLMGLAANIIASVIERHHWIAYVGLAVILWVAGGMVFDGWHDLQPHVERLIA